MAATAAQAPTATVIGTRNRSQCWSAAGPRSRADRRLECHPAGRPDRRRSYGRFRLAPATRGPEGSPLRRTLRREARQHKILGKACAPAVKYRRGPLTANPRPSQRSAATAMPPASLPRPAAASRRSIRRCVEPVSSGNFFSSTAGTPDGLPESAQSGGASAVSTFRTAASRSDSLYIVPRLVLIRTYDTTRVRSSCMDTPLAWLCSLVRLNLCQPITYTSELEIDSATTSWSSTGSVGGGP